MDEVVLYFYFCWIVVIILTFFIRTSTMRIILIIWIYLIISSLNFGFTISDLEFFMPFLILFVGAMIYYVKVNKKTGKIIHVLIVMIAVVAILIWQLLMPAWYIVTTLFFLPLTILLIIQLLVSDLQERITLCLLGMSCGQLLYDLIIVSYGLNNTIGTEKIMTQICIIVLNLLIIHFVHTVLSKIKYSVQNRYNM